MGFRVIGLLGDSIANGYWDDCGGWFSRLQNGHPNSLGHSKLAEGIFTYLKDKL